MIIHIGDDIYIYKEDIVAILDKKSAESNKDTRNFINKLGEDNCIIGPIDRYTKTYVLVSQENNTNIYTSRISSKALVSRNI